MAKSAADWLAEAEDYYAEWQRTGDDWYLAQYRRATLNAQVEEVTGGSTSSSSGANSILNTNDRVQVRGTSSNDSIYNNASNVTVYGGAGNDTIRIEAESGNANVYVSMFGGQDNDLIQNYGADRSLIDGDTGDDVIDNWGKNVTISGGEGNDSIKLDRDGAENCLIEYFSGDGNDTVVGFGTTSTLSIGEGTGTYSSVKSGKNVIVTVGDGSITLSGAASLSSVNIQGSVSSSSSSNPKLIMGKSVADSIVNTINGATIMAFGGNDSIENLGGYRVSISGGAGNDDIVNNDAASNVTINAGTGDDTIFNAGSNVVFKYTSGDGNDIIYNLGTNCKLSIDDGTGLYSTVASGNDLIVTVGDGKITLSGAASSSTVNIQGSCFGISTINSNSNRLVNGTRNSDYIRNYGDNVTINGSTGDDTIENTFSGWSESGGIIRSHTGADNVSISGGDDKDSITNWGSSVIIDGGFGADTINHLYGESITINGSYGNDLINLYDGYKDVLIAYYPGNGNDTVTGFNDYAALSISNDTYSTTYSTQMSGDDVIIHVGNGAGSIKLENVRSSSSGLNINGQTIEFERKIINLTDGDNSITNHYGNASISGDAGNDNISNDGNKVIINAGAGNDYIRNDHIYRMDDGGGENVTIDGGLGDDTINNGVYYALINAGASNDSIINSGASSTIDGGNGDDTIRNDSNGYYASINAGTGNDSIINRGASSTIDGGDGNDYIRNTYLYTIARNYYGDKVSINGGAGDDTISNESGDNVTIDGGAGDDYIYNSYGHDVMFLYSEGDGNDTISGFRSDSTLGIAAANYSTVESGSDIIVTVGTGKITLQGAASMETVNINFANPEWRIYRTTATYGTSFKTLIAVDGVKSLDGISLRGKTVTVSDASLNNKNVTVSNGYTLKLGSNVVKPATSKAWSLSKTTASYKQTKTAGYTLADNAITYSKKSSTTLATVKGVKSLDGLKLSKKVITVSASALNKKSVTVSDGYTLKLGNDVTKTSTAKAWTLNKSTASYQQTTTAGYKLVDNAITYAKKSVETLATVKGVKSLDGLKLNKKIITISAAALNKKSVTVSDGYTLKLGSDVTKTSTAKAWTLNKTTASYNQTTSAGYKLADNSITYAKKSVETLATVKGAKSAKGLSVSGKKITLKNSALSDKVTVSGGYEFDFASDYKNATITGGKSDDTITARGKNISINGSAGNDLLYGGAGKDTLIGGKGDDSLWGNAGADTFIYSNGDGNDVICGFGDNDLLKITGAFSTSYSKSKGEVYFKVDSGSITLHDFTATTFNVNGIAYKISGTKLSKK